MYLDFKVDIPVVKGKITYRERLEQSMFIINMTGFMIKNKKDKSEAGYNREKR